MDLLFAATLERTALLQRAQQVIAGLATDSAALLWELDARHATSFAPEAVAALSAALPTAAPGSPSTQSLRGAIGAEDELLHSCNDQQRLLARAYNAISALQVDVDALLWEIDQDLQGPGAASPVPFPVLPSPAAGHQTAHAGSATTPAVSAAGKCRTEAASQPLPAAFACGAPASPQLPVLSIGSGQTGGSPIRSSGLEQQASGSAGVNEQQALRVSSRSGDRITSPANAQAEQEFAASTPAAAPASWLFAPLQEQQQQQQTLPDAEVVDCTAFTTSDLGVMQQLSPKTKDFVRQAYVAREAQMVQLAAQPLPVQGTSLKEARAQTARMRSLREALLTQAAEVGHSGNLLAEFNDVAAHPVVAAAMQRQQQKQPGSGSREPAAATVAVAAVGSSVKSGGSETSDWLAAGCAASSAQLVPSADPPCTRLDQRSSTQGTLPLFGPGQHAPSDALVRLLSSLQVQAQPSAPATGIPATRLASPETEHSSLLQLGSTHSWTSRMAPDMMQQQQRLHHERVGPAAGSGLPRSEQASVGTTEGLLVRNPSSFIQRMVQAAQGSSDGEPGKEDRAAASLPVKGTACVHGAGETAACPAAAAAGLPATTVQNNLLFHSGEPSNSSPEATQRWDACSSFVVQSSMQACELLPPGLAASYVRHSSNPLCTCNEPGDRSSMPASIGSSAAALLALQRQQDAAAAAAEEPAAVALAEHHSTAIAFCVPAAAMELLAATEKPVSSAPEPAPAAERAGSAAGSRLAPAAGSPQQAGSQLAPAEEMEGSPGPLTGVDSLLDELEAGMAVLGDSPVPEGPQALPLAAVVEQPRQYVREALQGRGSLLGCLEAAPESAAIEQHEQRQQRQQQRRQPTLLHRGLPESQVLPFRAEGKDEHGRQPAGSEAADAEPHIIQQGQLVSGASKQQLVAQTAAVHCSPAQDFLVHQMEDWSGSAGQATAAQGGSSEASIADSFAHPSSSHGSLVTSEHPSPSFADNAAARTAALLRLHGHNPVHHRQHDSVGSLPPQSVAASPPVQSAAGSPPGGCSLRASASGGTCRGQQPQWATSASPAREGTASCGQQQQQQQHQLHSPCQRPLPTSLLWQAEAAGEASAAAAFEAACSKEAEAARLEREGLYVEAASAALEADRLHSAVISSKLTAHGLESPFQLPVPSLLQQAATVACAAQSGGPLDPAVLQQAQVLPEKLGSVLPGGEPSCTCQAAEPGSTPQPAAAGTAAAAAPEQQPSHQQASFSALPVLAHLLSAHGRCSTADGSMHCANSVASETGTPAQRTQRAQAAMAVIASKQARAAQRAAVAEAESAHLVAAGRAEEAAAAANAASKWRRRADKAARVVQQAAKVVQRLEAEAMAPAAGSPAVQINAPVDGGSIGSSKDSIVRSKAAAAAMAAAAVAPGAAVVASKQEAVALKSVQHPGLEAPLLPLPVQHEQHEQQQQRQQRQQQQQQQQQQQAVLNMMQPQSLTQQPSDPAASAQCPASSGSMAAGAAAETPEATCAAAASSLSSLARQPAELPLAGRLSSALSNGCLRSTAPSKQATLEQEAAPLAQRFLGGTCVMPEPGASKGGRDALQCAASSATPLLGSPLTAAAGNEMLLDIATPVPVAIGAGDCVSLELNDLASTTYEPAAAAAAAVHATTKRAVEPGPTPCHRQPRLLPDFAGDAGEPEVTEAPRSLAVGSGHAAAVRPPSSAGTAAASAAAEPSARAQPRPLPAFCSAIGPAGAEPAQREWIPLPVAAGDLRVAAAAGVQAGTAAAPAAAAADAAPAAAAPGAQPPSPASPLAERSLNALQAQLDRLERQLARSREQRARAGRLCGARRAAGAGAGAAAGSAHAHPLPTAVTWLSGFARAGSDEAESSDSPAWLRGFAGVTP